MFQFCPKCKSILRPRKEGSKVVLYCSCGYTSGSSGGLLKEDKQVKKEEAELSVVEKDINTLPITKDECPKCGNREAYYWLQQTRAGDEAETKFMKCTKCKHTWRDYS
ncbi:MAG: transcription factor S [Nanoarchaeota archaeon]|nr:transcription factor S [Nanoarchaeota archaeon]